MLDSLDTLIAFTLIMLVVSLLITITVQMVSSAVNLRGWNLAKGLRMTLETVLPGADDTAKAKVKDNARKIVDKILMGPMISDSSVIKHWPDRWRLATAVRPDEVFDAIHRIALGKTEASDDLKKYAQDLLAALGMDKKALQAADSRISAAKRIVDGTIKEVKAVIKNASNAASAVQKGTQPEEFKNELINIADQLERFATAEAIRITQSGIEIARAVDTSYQKFQYWCSISQERVQQWFAMHTRYITVLFAIIFTLWFQLDTIEIFKLVSTNHAVRDKLIAQVSMINSQTEKILADSNSVQQEALATFIANQTDSEIKKALQSVKADSSDTREGLSRKVYNALAPIQGKEKKVVGDFDTSVNDAATGRLKKGAGDFQTVKADIDKTGFDLIPANGKGRWGDNWRDGLTDHLWGMIFSVALLSLGAPFWYNTLKSLSSLRSTVAGNMSDEQKQAQKQTDSGTAKAPPTI